MGASGGNLLIHGIFPGSTNSFTFRSFFWTLDNIFLTIYFWEFILKFYAEAFRYFMSVGFERTEERKLREKERGGMYVLD